MNENTYNPAQEALDIVLRYPHSNSAVGLTKLLLTVSELPGGFSIPECLAPLDISNLSLATRVIEQGVSGTGVGAVTDAARKLVGVYAESLHTQEVERHETMRRRCSQAKLAEAIGG